MHKHLKKLAIALGVAASLPAFAAIDNLNGAELFAVVWDEDVGSYTLDLGVTIDQVLAGSANPGGYSFSFNVGSAFAQFQAADGNANDFVAGGLGGTRWAIFAADGEGFADPGDFRYITTSTDAMMPVVTNDSNNTLVPNVSAFAGTVSFTGTHTVDVAVNGESYNPKGTDAAFVEDNYFGQIGVRAGSRVGDSTDLFFMTSASYEPFDSALIERLNGRASFDGTTFSYNVSAVPEPGTYTLLAAGLAAVAFMARRRQRG